MTLREVSHVVRKTMRDDTEIEKVRHLNRKRQDAVDRLVAVIKDLADQKFTGYLKLNFSQGSLARVEKFEEILK